MSKYISLIFVFLICFFFTSCKMYPLHYVGSKDNLKYIYPIKISVISNIDKQEIQDNLISFTSNVLTKQRYQLNIVVKANIDNSIIDDNFKNTGRITLEANYSLIKVPEGEILYKNRTYVTSIFDFSNQKFSTMRSIKNSKNNAIQELSENIYVDIISFIKNIE
ncbi:hypothetical protein [Candidatus Liberibacter brunswickensis]|uniref:hypothetical protein n=1 Tax=Candidatus Liberibacter brunswickensis TaxID=1968796 RepID=UPI002FE0B7B3